MKNENRAVGKKGEDIAARFLVRRGYRILARNFRAPVGEIDIVARKKGMLVFAEVKTRRNSLFGPPYLAVNHKKRKKLIRCAFCYLRIKGLTDLPWRIDVISLELRRFCQKIEHFKNAVEE